MGFDVGDLVMMERTIAKMHMNKGGYGEDIMKIGVVIAVRAHPLTHEGVIKVKFPGTLPPEEWLGSDFVLHTSIK